LGTIITVCPVTDQDISTGIETDLETFSRISAIVGRVWCPHCKSEHEWSVSNAKIRDIGSGERSGA
jgi:hypothetical protein